MYILGQPIGEILQKHLKGCIDKETVLKASKVSGVNLYTVRNLATGANTVTLSNVTGLQELITEGLKNCEQQQLDLEQRQEYLLKAQDQIEEFISTENEKRDYTNNLDVKE